MSFEPTHQQRFNRAIYLFYVENNYSNDLKRISKEDFYRLLENDLQRKKTIEFDKNRIYRLADERIVCYGKYGRLLGEIWKEEGVESYWIDKTYIN